MDTEYSLVEIPQNNPTEASNGFLKQWVKDLNINYINAAIWAGTTGVHIGSERYEAAVLTGIAAGWYMFAGANEDRSRAVENRSLTGNANQMQTQGNKK